MFEPVRGGTRGGQAEFKWADVSADKDRENYLGHSVNAPTGRWQKNKDIHWYNRDNDADGAAEKAEEIRKIKELEAEALSAALGYEPTKPTPGASSSGANAVPVASTSAAKYAVAPDADAAARAAEKAERHRAREARREEKRARKERKRLERGDERPRRHPSRSRSPARPARSRSRTPPVRSPPRHRERRVDPAYDAQERESERERDRRRWELSSARREAPGGERERRW
ncbi:hypothetical protein HYPSUDRAFT_209635 [Hypholoma sublateritium FD-334 SS-4]|uniref:Multiple myeloma tumor-associated protein 2-like N-terminal domain-containing protein n=1 Tax=Hypholoma sublateritium (strain FD-334 SS-4) TaxID=945553 RepID=A0A0D2KFW0_HYPSF|nr:hypothetical protein HYPSUDRAFT_209635 [Hypholoma sublateritium FD-334 SS-4]